VSLDPPRPHLEDVVHELHAPGVRDSRTEAFLSCLLAWAAVNELPVTYIPGTRRITVNVSDRTIGYWVTGDAPQTPGARVLQVPINLPGNRLEKLPLVAEPVGILIGEKVCGHMVRRGKSTLRCNVETDAFGQHPSVHVDGLHDHTEWPNEHPGVLSYRRGYPDVTGRPAEAQHILVLTAAEERANMAHTGVTAARDIEGLAGRRRILERHAPGRTGIGILICSQCLEDHGYPNPAPWPCDDYRDAAAGLVTGLETT
jgi:hypothetical protein